MRATLRWAHADLRAHRGEAVFIVLATAGIIASLLLASALSSYAANPWQRIFTQSEGAHVWIHTRAADPADQPGQTSPDELAELSGLGRLDGVEAVSGPYRTARTTAEARGAKAAVELRAADAEPPRVGRPLIDTGRWLTARGSGSTDAVVLESSLAEALWAEPGDTLTVPAPDGGTRELRVVGVAETAEPRYQAGERPGIGWVLPATLDTTAPASGGFGQTIGLRLDSPEDTEFMVQRAVTALGADQVAQVTNWRQARADAEGDDRLLGLLFGVFGLGALLAAALVGSGAISARIRGQLRDISVLKAIGFTPAQVVRIFLLQHLAFAVLGIALGTAAIVALGVRIPGRIGDAVGVWQQLPGYPAPLLAITGAAVLFIATATALAAWRAGRVPPVPAGRAAQPGTGRMTPLTRRALRLNIPPALVLGWRGAFPRRARALAPVARLAVSLLLVTVALSAWATLDRFQSQPEQLGLPAALTARAEQPGDLGDREAQRLLTGHRDVAAAHPGAEVAALVPGQTGTITLRGLGTERDPYPATVAEGRPAHGPDEAVAGQGLLDALGVRVGDWVRMTVAGRPQILHIVGRSIEPEDDGRVISTTIDTLRERDPGLRPDFYQLVLRPGADPEAVNASLSQDLGGTLELREVPNPADGLAPARAVIAGLIVVLALIGLTELLTTIGVSVRDRGRDLLALKAIGLTPRQISSVIVASTGFTALAAAALGTGLGVLAGRWLVDAQGRSSGIGAGIAQAPPTPILLAVATAAVVGAVAVSWLPAARAARRRLADSLSETL